MRTLEGRILTDEGWLQGQITFDHRVQHLSPAKLTAPDRTPRTILPGFIDLHVHGGAGVDIMEGGDSARKISRMHAGHGTTALLATTMTAPESEIVTALKGISRAMVDHTTDGARILGAHLEGPFLNAKRLGAQPPFVTHATLELVERFRELAPITVLTLAPEVDGHLALIPQLSALGIRVQLGHSSGSYEDGLAALRAGASGFTHLFNGMTGFSHYNPGMVGAALAHAEYAELIPDLHHVAPGAILAAMRSIPRLYCVTDATAATGMPDGEYSLGSQRVIKCQGCVRLRTGSLAGSSLTMDQALRNLVGLGLDLGEASKRLSAYPALYLGLQDRGRIAAGTWADLVVLNEQLEVEQVFVEGRAIPLH